jgi:hypothetical protein
MGWEAGHGHRKPDAWASAWCCHLPPLKRMWDLSCKLVASATQPGPRWATETTEEVTWETPGPGTHSRDIVLRAGRGGHPVLWTRHRRQSHIGDKDTF